MSKNKHPSTNAMTGRVNNYGVLEKRWLVKIFTT